LAKVYKYCSGMNPVCKMLTIYIQEASDGCGINKIKPVEQFHGTITDRIAAAKRYIQEAHEDRGEVVCDSMDNGVLEQYHSFPDRIVVISKGVVVHDGSPGDDFGIFYNVESVHAWLEKTYPNYVFTDKNKEKVKEKVNEKKDDSKECAT
jgi:hypothetical protein